MKYTYILNHRKVTKDEFLSYMNDNQYDVEMVGNKVFYYDCLRNIVAKIIIKKEV